MNEKRHSKANAQRGNALVYVLIAIALFAALSMTLGRQTDTSEANSLSDEKAQLLATQITGYAGQVASIMDQMILTITPPDNLTTRIEMLNFDLPSAGSFNTPPLDVKVYHPEGGGLNSANLPQSAISQVSNDPPPGWYLESFENIEWTETTNEDVVLVAFQINPQVCAKINEMITGSTAIPELTGAIRDYFIYDDLHGGNNQELTTDDPGDICPECDGRATLCVKSNGAEEYGFYSIVATQ